MWDPNMIFAGGVLGVGLLVSQLAIKEKNSAQALFGCAVVLASIAIILAGIYEKLPKG